MRILTRYILGEILFQTFIGGALFTFVLLMKELPHILEMMVRSSSGAAGVLEVFLFTLPNFFMVTIPIAVLVGILLGFSRLAADSEIIAMRASGLGIGYFVWVGAIVAILGTLLGLGNSLYVAPRANQAIMQMDRELAAQASFDLQPRVFDEDVRDHVLYVQNVVSGTGAANWKQVFIADVTDPLSPKITTAASATVMSDSSQGLLMRLRNGTDHETVSGQPEQYNVSTFQVNDLPLMATQQNEGHLGRLDTNIYAMPLSVLRAHTHGADAKRFQIELQKRFAYPAACMVLMLVGVPLGVISRRGGKSSAWVATIGLVAGYYSLTLIGIALARQNWIPAFVAVWLANLIFGLGGIFLLWQNARGGSILNAITSWTTRAPKVEESTDKPLGAPLTAPLGKLLDKLQPQRKTAERAIFPRILDAYVVREFLFIFTLVLSSFVMLVLVFTIFDLLSDILRNHIAWSTVGAYLLNLTPMMLYEITPLAVLIAVLVTFGVLNRNSEIVAMKATGISLYRLVIPVIAIAAMLAAALFLFGEYYLPRANQRQEALRNIIKGRPAQTVLHPEQKWIFGEPRAGEPGRIFYYQFFDSDRNEFANLSLFEFNPSTFALTRRIFAGRASWDATARMWRFRDGWQRDFAGSNIVEGSYHEFQQTSFSEIHEEPSYFNKKEEQSQEMNFGQLSHYIDGLRQSGFDTMRLRVALWHKLAYPFIAVVMAVLAIPFALSMGRRGALTGIAWAIGVALVYMALDGLFGALGNVNILPAALAAWSSDILFGLVGGYLLLKTPT